MSKIEIRLLGPPGVRRDGCSLHIPRRQTRALLFRLAAALTPTPREHLCFLLWSDRPEQEARRNLSHLLTHLRAALPEPDAIAANDDYVMLNLQFAWSDVIEFVDLRNACDDTPALETLHELADLYRGPLLLGFSLPSSPEYESWITLERQSLERVYLETLAILIERHIQQGNYAEAIEYANNYLFINSFDEEVHRRLVELYSITGDRGAALGHYQRCADILLRDLGLRPSQEMRTLYLQVLQDEIGDEDLQGRVTERMLALQHHKQHRLVPEYPFVRRHRMPA